MKKIVVLLTITLIAGLKALEDPYVYAINPYSETSLDAGIPMDYDQHLAQLKKQLESTDREIERIEREHLSTPDESTDDLVKRYQRLREDQLLQIKELESQVETGYNYGTPNGTLLVS